MTILELRNALDALIARHPDAAGLAAVVETQNGGCPARYASPVVGVRKGFDWTANQVAIKTADQLVVVRNLAGIARDHARARLDALKAAHARIFESRGVPGKYIPKAQEWAWMEGYCEGVWAHVTACEDKP